MVKGVHRQIIEIRQTEHPYFERALLFVREDLSEIESAWLHSEAERLLKASSAYSALRRDRRRLWARRVLWATGGAAVALFFYSLLQWVIR